MSGQAMPVGGPLTTRAMRALVAVAAVGLAVMIYRFFFGIGAIAAINDGYPWGLWIALDVVTGTALACGGYATALLVYVFNKGKYHPLVRSALLTSALGYTMAIVAVTVDIGRYWNLWHVPLFVWHWNLDSILLEVALCVAVYTMVVWIEMSPAFFERWKTSSNLRLRRLAQQGLPFVERNLIWFVALGLLLPTMHQSSLGGVLLLAGQRLHALWNTPLLPLLFLLSCLSMGYAAVILESTLSSRLFQRRFETAMLAGIGGVVIFVQLAFVVVRMLDIVMRGHLSTLFAFDLRSNLVLIEFALLLAPVVLLRNTSARMNKANLFRGALLLAAGGALYRIDSYLVAFQPGAHWSYFPSIGEMVSSMGLIAIETIAFVVIVKQFPILSGAAAARREEVAV